MTNLVKKFLILSDDTLMTSNMPPPRSMPLCTVTLPLFQSKCGVYPSQLVHSDCYNKISQPC